jgi:hypothetical protein
MGRDIEILRTFVSKADKHFATPELAQKFLDGIASLIEDNEKQSAYEVPAFGPTERTSTIFQIETRIEYEIDQYPASGYRLFTEFRQSLDPWIADKRNKKERKDDQKKSERSQ